MDALYARREASATDVQRRIPSPPSYSTVAVSGVQHLLIFQLDS